MKRALIITGEQGSGRTSRARVEAHGSYVETTYDRIKGLGGIDRVLASEPDTVIVDEMPPQSVAWQYAKALVVSEEVVVNVPYEKRKFVKTPNFIFIADAEDPFALGMEPRRFEVIRL